MPDIFISISGFETIYQRLMKLPREAQDMGVEEANEYMVNMMRVYPPKSRAPFVWSSDKQRRFVMAKIRSGEWTGRTQALANSWKTVGKGYHQTVESDSAYASYVQDRYQIVGHKSNGWQTINQLLNTNGKKILAKFDAGVKRAIKKLKLG